MGASSIVLLESWVLSRSPLQSRRDAACSAAASRPSDPVRSPPGLPPTRSVRCGPMVQNGDVGRPYPPPARAEPFWPALATVLGAIALQLLLPKRLTAGPTWLLPALEGALLLGLAV